ncbi:hypothetical protein [Halarcobacter sp.]|uniref:hypothetical protein n=1 Tax=Halarcobacter sp. TaxID=2321133 RepID=UPI0029F4AEA9|nr:hypothetical protein [Halarcobacter sp.]
MPKIALIFFIAFELCYYLLIAQTGIVEYFASNIYYIAPLPIGGIIGSILCYKISLSNDKKIKIFLMMQLVLTFFYPNYSPITLFILGISVGALAPLLINELKKASTVDLGLALAISYSVGTLLFNYDPAKREFIAIIFTVIVLICSYFLQKIKTNKEIKNFTPYPIFVMVLWIFLDSALFETLSRDLSVSIWRDGFTSEIIVFHIIGVIAALKLNIQRMENELFIMILFALSYLFYFLQEPLALSVIYPFVISYYNVNILRSLVKKPLKKIALYMVFIGWIASGMGLFIALENLTIFVPFIFLIAFIKIINSQKNLLIKEKKCIN